ncbi:hypothetical protein ACA910_016470 [Epithemia clementina (nom. ined.)]
MNTILKFITAVTVCCVAIVTSLLSTAAAEALTADLTGTTTKIWETTGDANQGVAVDDNYIYAVDNRRITKMNKTSGEHLLQWDGDEDFPDGHFDSGEIVDGFLYCSNSNWPLWPMASSVEIFDPATMEHVATHSFGITLGSFTWLSWNAAENSWYGAFANYDRYQSGAMDSYGKGYNTQIARMSADTFQILELFEIPLEVRETFDIMSNSGGSWGPDGYLYISGHDLPQVYVMEKPIIGHTLHLVAVIDVPDIEGQGIAWDRWTEEPTLYGIYRPNKTVIVTAMPTKDEILAVARPQKKGTVHEYLSEFSH